MKSLDIHQYTNPRQFLLDSLTARQKQNPKFSVRAWAKEMGTESHSLLLLLLQGKRPLRQKHVSLLVKGLNLNSQERLYFQALIQFDNADAPEEKEACKQLLENLNPGQNFKTRELEEFEVISHWLYTAILIMTKTRGFDGSDKDIYRRLKHRGVTIHEIRSAVERLLSLDLLRRLPDGCLEMTCNHVTSRNDVANIGVRKYHRQVLDLAIDALEQVPLANREFQSISVSISRSRIPLAKEMIRKFRAQFIQVMGEEPGDEVCQLNIQMFQLTESPAVNVEDEGVDTECNNKPTLNRKEQCHV